MENCYGWKNEKKDSQITELRTFTDGKMKKKRLSDNGVEDRLYHLMRSLPGDLLGLAPGLGFGAGLALSVGLR